MLWAQWTLLILTLLGTGILIEGWNKPDWVVLDKLKGN